MAHFYSVSGINIKTKPNYQQAATSFKYLFELLLSHTQMKVTKSIRVSLKSILHNWLIPLKWFIVGHTIFVEI